MKPGIGLIVSGFFVSFVFRHLSWDDVTQSLTRANLRLVPVAIASLACGYALRVTRWWLMLRMGLRGVRWGEAAAAFLISIAANNVLPLRVGDAIRLFAFPARPGLEPSRVAGTLLVERLLDLVILLGIFSLVLTWVPASGSLATLASLGHWVAIAGLLAAAAVFSLPLFDRWLFSRVRVLSWALRCRSLMRLLDMEAMLAQTIADLCKPRQLLPLVVLSLLVWAFEGGLFVSTLAAFGVPAVVVPGLFALAVATLATLLPSSPGYVGTFHFFAIQALAAFGIDPNLAAAFAIAAHLLLWLPTTLAGLIAFVWKMVAPAPSVMDQSR